jgi:tRNA 2-thiouridine synthesizing protein C
MKKVLFVVYQAPVGSIWVNEAFRTTFGMYGEDIEPAILLMDEAVTAIAERNEPERVGLLPVKIVKKYIKKYGTEVYAVKEDLEKFKVEEINQECLAKVIPISEVKALARSCDFVIFM